MERLTLHEIAPYLPYGLYYQLKGNFPLKEGIDNFIEEIFKLNPFGCEVKKFVEWDTCKPILRPMNLTTPIKIDGVEVVPIVELFKMVCFRNYDEHADMIFLSMKLDCEGDNWLRVLTDYTIKTELLFTYEKGSFSFKRITPKYEDIEVIHQLKMFQYLYKNKFDIHGLIPAGLAVDVNTLETNPYEL